MGTRKQNHELSLAKFIFAILIALFHTNRFATKAGANPIFIGGWSGTEFFFIVSGYLMAISAKKYVDRPLGQSTFDFIVKKLKTIYPFYIMAFILGFAVRQYIFSLNRSISGTIFSDFMLSIKEIFLIQSSGIKTGTTYNGPTWYISVMLVAMTILFPLLLKFRDWYTNIGGLTISIFSYAFISQNSNTLATADWSYFTTLGILRAIAAISLGVFLYGMVEQVKIKNFTLSKKGRALLLLSEIGAYTLLFWIAQNLKKLKNSYQFDYIMVIIIVYICFVIFSELSQINNILPAKVCSFLGTISFPIYLFQRPIINFLVGINNKFSFKNYLVIYAIALAVLVVLSMLFLNLCGFIRKKFGPKIHNALVETQIQ